MFMKRLDLVGQRYGRLAVISFAGVRNSKMTWLCRCDCGTEKIILGDNLGRGRTKSCGCRQRETRALNGRNSKRHGHRGEGKMSPEYRSWSSMLARCANPNHKDWRRYGGRGITVCERWQGEHGFENFYSDMGPRPPGTSIDRRENDPPAGYSSDNCWWATPKEQAANRRLRLKKAA